MKIYQLDPEEEEILKAFEEGKLVRVKNLEKEKKVLREAARNTLKKTTSVILRLSEKVVHKLKVKAAEEGIPYQTLASSILHKFVNK